jgi:hypothetical protein
MNKKIMYMMLIVLALLLVISYALKSLDSPDGAPESLSALKIEFDPDSVAGIDVYKQEYPDSGLHFVKVDTLWVITNEYNAPAKQADIASLLKDLQEAGGQVRGESADLYDDFEISDDKALQIELFGSAGAKLLHLYVGKGGSGRECFVRLAGSPTVYLADNNFISRFAAWNSPPEKKLPADRWLELQPLARP